MIPERFIEIHVDSAEELAAFMIARAAGQIVTRRRISDTLTDVEAENESGTISRFRVHTGFPDGNSPASRYGRPTTESLDILMRAAVAFSAENPPHHPGTLARFPVPSERYPGRVEVPLAVIARDGAVTGLYAPPRVAVLDWQTAESVGIGEFPGFHPEAWPPPHLGGWPPEGSRTLSAPVLLASVARLSGCWGRLIDHSLGGAIEIDAEDVADVRALLTRLELPGMDDYYRRISPRFVGLLSL